jgi:hypothetical protein
MHTASQTKSSVLAAPSAMRASALAPNSTTGEKNAAAVMLEDLVGAALFVHQQIGSPQLL